MPKREPVQPEARKNGAKKLRKREQRLLGRLEEAHKSYESALLRLQRAEARLQKRQQRVDRLSGRLALVRQQLQTDVIPQRVEEPEQLVAVYSKYEAVSIEQASAESLRDDEEQEVLLNSMEPALELEDITEPELELDLEPEQDDRQVQPQEESVTGNVKEEEEIEMVEEQEPAFELQEIVTTSSTSLEEEQQDLSEPIIMDRKAVLLDEAWDVAEVAEQAAHVATLRTNHLLEHLEQILDGRYLFQELERLQTEATTLSSLARAARESVDELLQLSTSADNEEAFARLVVEIENQRQVLGQVRLEFSIDDSEETDVEEEDQPLVEAGKALDLSEEEIVFDLPANLFTRPSASYETSPFEQPVRVEKREPFSFAAIEGVISRDAREEKDSQELPASGIEQLDEDEKEIETVAAMLVANVAAAAAAEAEALAEASSIRTHDARTVAIQADQVLEQIRIAIDKGTLFDFEAQTALQIAERAATEAHGALADAEAAEEQAISIAINAEAEAEVAEGMALASHDREEAHEQQEPSDTEMTERRERFVQTDEHLVVSKSELEKAAARLAADEEEIRDVSAQELV